MPESWKTDPGKKEPEKEPLRKTNDPAHPDSDPSEWKTGPNGGESR